MYRLFIIRECEEDDDSAAAGPNLKQFFGGVGEKRPKRAAYFQKKKMKHVLPSDLFT